MLIAVRATDDPSLHKLARWLDEDGYQLTMSSSGDVPGAQGALDVINVIVSNSTAIAALVVSYASWRGAKPHEEPARFTFRRGDVELTLENPTGDDIKRAIEALTAEES